MPTNTYVVLTGAKNNAGDFLIKQRTRELLHSLRPDRGLVEYDSWRQLDHSQLEVVNASRALILAGGPALQGDMWPGIFPLTHSLSDIKVPIVAMGVGWKSPVGDWESTHNYVLSERTVELLKKLDGNASASSVRDYHTLNVLLGRGLNNFVMSGCPALFSLAHVGKPAKLPTDIGKIGFSAGVSFSRDAGMDKIQKDIILTLKGRFGTGALVVAFHHSLGSQFELSYSKQNPLYVAQKRLATWLESEGIDYVDVSGDSSKMIAFYAACDLHVGYRVHAHVLMSSISKPSVLITEDGRGRALANVIGGLIFEGYSRYARGWYHRLADRAGIGTRRFVPTRGIARDVVLALEYERLHGYPRLLAARAAIDSLYGTMSAFVKQLP
jgi:hypothetical protein